MSTLLKSIAALANLQNAPRNIRVAETQRTFGAIRRSLAELSPEKKVWLGTPEFAALFSALLGTLEQRTPSTSSVPRDRGRREEILPTSHPGALKARMDNICASSAGRALMRLAPLMAARDMTGADFDGAYSRYGLTHRDQASFFAGILSSAIGREAARLAAQMAQGQYSARFWANDTRCKTVSRIVVGNGPVGVAFAHALIEAGDNNRTLILSASVPGGPFAWGSFQVNHRTRPVTTDFRSGPATSGPLDDFGATLLSPSDVSTTWGYTRSDTLAATTALNALAAGPIVTATVEEIVSCEDNRAQVTLRNPVTGEYKIVLTDELVLATGLGTPKSLPGRCKALNIKEFLACPEPSMLGERIAVVGDGDSAAIAIARLLGLNEDGTMPRQVQKLSEIVWIRPSGETTKEEFAVTARLRYSGQLGPFLPRLFDRSYPSPIRVVGGRVTDSGESFLRRQQLFCSLKDGGDSRVFADVVINATGFTDTVGSLCSNFQPSREQDPIVQESGVPIARRIAPKIYVIGAAAALPTSRAELRLYPVLNNKGLGENTVALFRTMPQAAKFGRECAGSKTEVGSPNVRGQLRTRKRAADPLKVPVERFGMPIAVVDGPGEDLSSLLCRMKLLAAAYGEAVSCPETVTVTICIAFGDTLYALAEQPLPSAVIRQVLKPMFGDECVRRGLWQAYTTTLNMQGGANQVLKMQGQPGIRNWALTIPATRGRMWPEGLSLNPQS